MEKPIPQNSRPTTVTADLECLTCGYNLRTLPVACLCPECGNAVLSAIEASTSGFQHGEYGKIARGLLIIGISNGLVLLLFSIAMVIIISERNVLNPIVTLFNLAFAIAPITCGGAVWHLTSNANRFLRREKRNLRIAAGLEHLPKVFALTSCAFANNVLI